ncbi:MAG TPA: NAD(P)/FAD-dependent oxidoreductase [Jatrophihabitans sp.]|nr:NAD(P)/FAD-dependent oxidoreductase [Jatrophihabitans sp.]
MTDAVIVGAGPNGLVAANLLVDAGWDVLVLEATEHAGGAIRSDNSLHPDFVTDLYSSFYPLAAASPILTGLELDRHGLQWSHAPLAFAHLWPDGRSAGVWRDADRTAAGLDSFAEGDGQAWLELVADFERIQRPLLDALFRPFPPVRPAIRLARLMGTADLLRFARFAAMPVRRFADEQFRGEAGGLLIAGNALHADLGPESAGSSLYGWLLAMLGQTVGYPVPVGGSGRITAALVDRFVGNGGQLRLDSPVTRVQIAHGRAVGVQLAGGERIAARQAVLTDVSAPALYRDLVGLDRLPGRLAADLARFQWDAPTVKVNWALSGPIPWLAEHPRDAGTVHLGVDLNGLSRYATALAMRQIPTEPFLLLGQMTSSDPSRSPAGTESAWAYTHLPEGRPLSTDELTAHVALIESVVQRQAPGFTDRILARSVQGPLDLQSANANLHGGAVGGGTAGIHQQLVFRPLPGLGRSETPIDRLYLASAAAHPGGGVHGGPGATAARAALFRASRGGRLQRRIVDRAFKKIYQQR